MNIIKYKIFYNNHNNKTTKTTTTNMINILLYKHTNKTFSELSAWRQKKNRMGTCYNIEYKLQKYMPDDKSPIFVMDINNDKNKIEGIGVIYKSKPKKMYRYNIYSVQETNRYSYKTPYYILRDELLQLNAKSDLCIHFLEYILFYGYRNAKRMEYRVKPLNLNLLLYAHSIYSNTISKSNVCIYCGDENNNHICDKMKGNTALLQYIIRYFNYLLIRFKSRRQCTKKGT